MASKMSVLLVLDAVDVTRSEEVQWVCNNMSAFQSYASAQIHLTERLCETAQTVPLALQMAQELPAVATRGHDIFNTMLTHIFTPTGGPRSIPGLPVQQVLDTCLICTC